MKLLLALALTMSAQAQSDLGRIGGFTQGAGLASPPGLTPSVLLRPTVDPEAPFATQSQQRIAQKEWDLKHREIIRPTSPAPELKTVTGQVDRWSTPNTIVVSYTEIVTGDVFAGTTEIRAVNSRDRQTVYRYERGPVNVTRTVTVTGVRAGLVRAGERVTLRCRRLKNTVIGMHASYAVTD